MTRAASRIRIRYSSSMPIPAATPAPSHHRGRSRSSAVAAHTVTTVQASMSYGVVFPTCMAPRKTGAMATASAAITRAARPPSKSAAIRAASTTIAPPASAGRIRIAVGFTPNRSEVRASSTASGGWSTYPNARW